MAREVIVRILNETEDIPHPTTKGTVNGPKASAKRRSEGKDPTAWVSTYAANKIWGAVKNEAVHFASKYIDATENYVARMMVDNATKTIDDFMGLAHAITTGAVMGGGIGAAVAAVLTVGAKAAQAFNTYADSSKSIIENAYGNYFYGTRAGFVAGGHDTEN